MIQYDYVVLQQYDIDSLRDRCYLEGQVIAFYFAYLKSTYKTDDVLLVEPTVSTWLARNQDDAGSFAEIYKLSTKSLVFFAVNGGDHWSSLVYHRSMNSFIHYDTMGAANHHAAMDMYEAVKSYMGPGGQVSKSQTSKIKRDKKKSARSVCKPQPLDVPLTAPAGFPVFKEGKDIRQQSNGTDCGLYVLAIAEVICRWFVDDNTQFDLLSAVAKKVDDSVEFEMRRKVLGIIQKVGKQKQQN